VFVEGFLDREIATRDLASEVEVDGSVLGALLAGLFLNAREFARGRFDIPGFDRVALHPRNIDGGENVTNSACSCPEIRRGPCFVDEFDRNPLDLVDYPRADQPGPVADPDQRIRRVCRLLVDDLGDPLRWHLEGRDDHLAGEHGDPRLLARIDADDRSSLFASQGGDDFLDGSPGRVGVAPNDLDIRRYRDIVVGSGEQNASAVRKLRSGFDGGKGDTTITQLRHRLVIQFEVGGRDDDHDPCLVGGALTRLGRDALRRPIRRTTLLTGRGESGDMGLTSPGLTVGVVGGGQLGRMLGEAASPLGVELIVSDPTPDAPAAPVVRDQIVGDFDDEETLLRLGERADVLTFEIELADPDTLERVREEIGTPVHPHPETLRLIQDKLVQKQELQDAGVPVPEFRQVDTVEELRTALDDLGYPAMLKARQGGYDGRGNVLVESETEVAEAFDAIAGPAMVEEFVDFERELAVMGCIGDDERDTFPLTETIHEEEILRETVSPPRTDERTRQRAIEVVQNVLDVLSGRGVYGIELFETVDGEILLNEIAPRPHNSGHWTIEGCHTSQFEQHIRAVTGVPLGSTERRDPTAIANILGDVDGRQQARMQGVDDVLATDTISLHWYGKREVYRLRKMGHISSVGEDPESVLSLVREVSDWLTFDGD